MHLRVARDTARLGEIARMYEAGLGLSRVGSFEDHAGFDGVMLGDASSGYHLEFTSRRGEGGEVHRPPPPSDEQHLVFYVPVREEYAARLAALAAAGFERVASANPYWDRVGATFADVDGHRIVVANMAWPPAPAAGAAAGGSE